MKQEGAEASAVSYRFHFAGPNANKLHQQERASQAPLGPIESGPIPETPQLKKAELLLPALPPHATA